VSDRCRWAIAVHGGAKEITPEEEEAHREGCRAALVAGAAILEQGGTAVEAVEAVIRVMEDDPTFNAGFGSVPNTEGNVEMDAGLMDGSDLRVGAVAAISRVRHPISVARLLLAEDPVLLTAEGALRFAMEHGADLLDGSSSQAEGRRGRGSEQRDTVGCVALDGSGNLAAGTSTGGLDGQPPGRIGDSPLPGCGFYADDAVGAVALSGEGEAIVRMMLGARIMHAMACKHPQRAVEHGIAELHKVKGEAGVIALDSRGELGWGHNSRHFTVGLAASDVPPRVFLSKTEERDA
jgi:L-asparaginase / beta-aspartyl-peptidase